MKKKILLGLLAIIIIIQFIKPDKNIHAGNQPYNIATKFTVPNDVQKVLQKACYDCHSNNTAYPWYSHLQPIAWFLNHHIVDGKKKLNFDEYTSKSLRYQYHKLEETEEMIQKGEMPLKSYTIVHKEAVLTQQEKEAIINWVHASKKQMEAEYPLDSLIKKR